MSDTGAYASRRDRAWLIAALVALSALFCVWFFDDPHRVPAYVFFAMPPLLLGIAAALNYRTARFWSGVLALLWFSHGVMMAWSEPNVRGFAMLETALALVIIFASNAAGLRARRAKKRGAQ